ncbi:DUF418 domain-containing protein [Puteibacter caeruleilacunae]|nr:DUF418 domain-containing protein [Puteibacter caeruleilacunae]
MSRLTQRIAVVDALRGFAIVSILLLHTSNHFLYGVMPENTSTIMQTLDASTKNILYFLFEGKAFGIFAILFGFTFGLQYFRAQEKGNDFRLRFLWRMLLLAGFGYLNAAFFAGGDPLVFMAIVAVVLPIVARLSSKSLIVISVLLILQPVELYKAISLWLNPDHELIFNTDHLYNLLKPAVDDGKFIAMAVTNITIGLKACLTWAVEFGRISQTPALYIIGFLLYKHGMFASGTNRFWKRLVIISAISSPLLYLLKSLPQDTNPVMVPLQIATTMWYNLSCMLLLISVFVLLFETSRFQRLTAAFQIYGKMSLTNFVFQSIIATFIFYPYGMHASPGIFVSVIIGVVIAIAQILFSSWWLRKYRQGPLEYLWRKATYFKV